MWQCTENYCKHFQTKYNRGKCESCNQHSLVKCPPVILRINDTGRLIAIFPQSPGALYDNKYTSPDFWYRCLAYVYQSGKIGPEEGYYYCVDIRKVKEIGKRAKKSDYLGALNYYPLKSHSIQDKVTPDDIVMLAHNWKFV